MTAAKLFAMILALMGPAPKDTPGELQLKAGDQIIAMGDSITAGGGYLRDTDAVLYQQYPDLKLPKIINVGIGGQKAEDMVSRFDKEVVQKKPQWVTISVGINDVWHRLGAPHDDAILAKYKANVEKMVDMAQAANIKVIILSPTVIQEDAAHEGNKRLPMYIDAEKEIAKDKKCQFVDLHHVFLDALKKKPEDVKGNWLTGDGVHMNEKGDAIMAVGVLRALGVPDKKISASEATPWGVGKKPATKPATKPAAAAETK